MEQPESTVESLGSVKKMEKVLNNKDIKKEILYLTRKYYNLHHKNNKKLDPLRINYSARVYNENEMMNLVDSSLDFWLTYGKWSKKFEKELAEFLGVKYCSFVNSGSSANLLAFLSLTSALLKERRILPGDEVITVAAGFPTTVAPIIQYGAIPVFIDVNPDTFNINIDYLKRAITKKTKAVFIAHTLGNPFDIDKVIDICKKNKLWLIEDNFDSFGSKYKGKFTGTFGDIGTSSFYPPHHITTGEGGAVYTDNPLLHKIMLSLRDWGRDCICESGQDNRCGKRFSGKFGDLPFGYDHKYVYSHFGYNLKATDMQASIGCAQLKKLPGFIKKRKENWNLLYNGLKKFNKYFSFAKAEKNSEPSWFGFLLTLKKNTPFTRDEITGFLEENNIQTRVLFAGNLIKHPCFDEMRRTNKGFKVVGNLTNTDNIMNNTFWIGVYPGINKNMIKKIISVITKFLNKKTGN